ncbi:MAG: aldo/keto reductase [Candidatus Sericytochromatia bacterium]|nr:aldo/keto reductase [Candidatus Sericytochromatia bacterium]
MNKLFINKIVIGSVQFGMDYGINNLSGKTSKEDVFIILDYVNKNGIKHIDTSYLYGDSEAVLGCYEHIENFKIVSKCPSIDDNVKKYFYQSLKRLNQRKLDGYLIHHFDFFLQNPKIWNELIALKDEGLVRKIGFSVYYPYQVEKLTELGIEPDIIQIPYNIFDQRFDYILEDKRYSKIEFYSRSVFLQGLVFKKYDELSNQFNDIKSKIKDLNDLSTFSKKNISELCLKFVLQNEKINKVIIGVDNLEQLKDILVNISNDNLEKNIYNSLLSFKEENENIILPFNWNKI